MTELWPNKRDQIFQNYILRGEVDRVRLFSCGPRNLGDGKSLTVPLYSIYGLVVDSELPLPEIPAAASQSANVSLRIGKVAFRSTAPSGVVVYKPLSSSEVIVHYDGVGTAFVRGGESIVLQPSSAADLLSVRLFVLQQVFGVVLLQRGLFVLHASAARMNGRVLAFAGPSGEGKSTMVAALIESGAQVVCDDVLAIDLQNTSGPMALPGLVQLKLTAKTQTEVAPRILSRQAIRDRLGKTLCEAEAGRVTEPTPLAAIYLLESGAAISIIEVPQSRAAIELVRHTYGSRLLQAIDASARHFEQAAALARTTPIFKLTRPRDLLLLPTIVEDLSGDFLGQAPAFADAVFHNSE